MSLTESQCICAANGHDSVFSMASSVQAVTARTSPDDSEVKVCSKKDKALGTGAEWLVKHKL